MSAAIGEYGLAKYIKHPPASTAGAPGHNGTTFDAGTACIVDSNVSWLCRESVRHLAFSPGPGSLTVFTDSSKVFTDNVVNLGPLRTDSAGTGVGEIPWDRRTAVRLGPFVLICDELNTGELVPRKVSFSAHVSVAASTTVDMYYAITTSPSTNGLRRGEHIIAYGKNAAVSAGLDTKALTPTIPVANDDVRTWQCRRSTSTGSGFVRLVPAWVWVGWRAIGTTTAAINGVSVWETR